MKKSLNVALVIIVGVALIGCFGDNKKSKSPPIVSKKNTDMELVRELKKKDCVEFIALVSAKDLATEFGWTESYVLNNHRINVWGKTTANGKFPKVGEMHPGSNALILERSGDDYKILSPLDNSIGWVNEVQVNRTHYQNPTTFKECAGK